eukprot:NODE_256_length_1726_cov_438.782349_g191_i0.p1 GENE.NODE_256_length_1726_cov_438.782349_g191_i0~~NODE_256_length_1726_cov_438.782349_g191_i0.p1  ORF type:complete len:363 (+),score=29.30 NODE_256_length_1726_cov_438.782349_g191_i0:125-1213(+)
MTKGSMSASKWQAPSPGSQTPKTPHSSAKKRDKPKDVESDPHRLEQRMKQIQYGENTDGHRNFRRIMEKEPWLLRGCVPIQPSVLQKCSKRSWDGQIRKWRRMLHMYDNVDFGENPSESAKVRLRQLAESINPNFAPTGSSEEIVVDGLHPVPTPQKAPSPSPIKPTRVIVPRFGYSREEIFLIGTSPLVSDEPLELPPELQWLDKRFDLSPENDQSLITASPSPSQHSTSYSPQHQAGPPEEWTPASRLAGWGGCYSTGPSYRSRSPQAFGRLSSPLFPDYGTPQSEFTPGPMACATPGTPERFANRAFWTPRKPSTDDRFQTPLKPPTYTPRQQSSGRGQRPPQGRKAGWQQQQPAQQSH